MKKFYRSWAEVNLDNIAHNLKEIRRITNKNAKILAVVKADAYGHGYLEVTKTLLDNGADALGVAFIDEAIQLRNRGISVPIIILGHTPEPLAEDLVSQNITPTVFSLSMANAVSEAAVRLNKKASIHIKVDTGMGRIGFQCIEGYEKAAEKIMEIAALPNIEVEGLFTHFASADEQDPAFTCLQFEKFMTLNRFLESKGLEIPIKHTCNSAAIIQFPEMHLDMVRPGLILYGHYPSETVDSSTVDLRPAMELKSQITNIKKVAKGIPISYNRKFYTEDDTVIATLPIGYGDGYLRSLTNQAQVIANDKKVYVIGRICMDQCMIDVTGVHNIKEGDTVTLFGSQNGHRISVESIAEKLNTINYEILCITGKRIPRVYIQNNKIVEVLNYLV